MMVVEYKPCKQGHLAFIRPQPHDRLLIPAYLAPEAKAAIENDFAMSAWIGSRCIGAAGIMSLNAHAGIAWALLGADAGPHLRELTRKAKSAIDISPYKRIEMRVIYDFEEGHRWAKLLGFGKPEAPRMRCSGVHGEDETLYARVR